jgi:transcriptional regulator with XRE-family HTH domain
LPAREVVKPKPVGTKRGNLRPSSTVGSEFFSAALREAMATRHFNQAQLAEFLRVDPAYISRWLKGSSPRLDQMCAVLDDLGWDLSRSHPDYSPFQDAITQVTSEIDGGKSAADTASLTKIEEVQQLLAKADDTRKRTAYKPVATIGDVDASNATAEIVEVDEDEGVEAPAAFFRVIPYADNDVVALRVKGSDLAFPYPEGTLLFARRVLKPADLPSSSLVIMENLEKGARLELRRLIRLEEPHGERIDRIVGAPVHASQGYLVQKPRESRMLYVVIGILQFTA